MQYKVSQQKSESYRHIHYSLILSAHPTFISQREEMMYTMLFMDLSNFLPQPLDCTWGEI